MKGKFNQSAAKWGSDLSRLTGHNHTPCFIHQPKNDSVRPRLRCKVCSKLTSFKCITCNAPLHIGEEQDLGCYEIFHSAEEFKTEK